MLTGDKGETAHQIAYNSGFYERGTNEGIKLSEDSHEAVESLD